MKKQKVQLFEIIKITAGGLHCWLKSTVGIIRKNNSDVPGSLWTKFNKSRSQEQS